MTGKEVQLEKEIATFEEFQNKLEFRATQFWYGPQSPFFNTQKEMKTCTYRHIFFPNQL